MIARLEDKANFKKINQLSWQKNADFWINQTYIHFGVKELLHAKIEQFGLNYNYNSNLTVLDVGCGSGWLADCIPNEAKYIGIDYCETFIKRLQSKNKNKKHQYFFTDIENQLDRNQISTYQADLIVCSLSLIETPYLDIIFNNLKKLLKKNGRIFIVSLNPLFELYRYSKNEKEYEDLLAEYRKSATAFFLSKKIKYNNNISDDEYFRILYSIDDYCRIALDSKLVVDDVITEVNRINLNLKTPVYQFLSLKSLN